MLQGKTAVITGGGRGIGKAIALLFAQNGANIAVIARSLPENASKLIAQLQSYDVQAKAYQCDVCGYDSAAETVRAIKSDFGTIDILVNNAGITMDGLVIRMSEQNFDEVLDVNLKGAFNFIRHAGSLMFKQKSGRIINISSVSGIAGNAGQANYSASKAGLIGLTKAVSKELGVRGITVNAIAPGFITTDMTESLDEKLKEKISERLTIKRFGTPEDVAELALFLASDKASYITGQVISVDGGVSL